MSVPQIQPPPEQVKWQATCLGDVCSIKHGFAFSGRHMTEELDNGPIVVGIGNFKYSGGFRFGATKIQRYNTDFPQEYELSPGDILLILTCQTPDGEVLGIPGYIPDDGQTYLHNQRLGLVSDIDQTKAHSGFLYYLFASLQFNRYLVERATGTKVKHTSPTTIESYKVPLPPLAEQRRIAEILSTWDRAIEQTEALIAARQRRKKALMQHLLTGKTRFPQFGPPATNNDLPQGWRRHRLGKLFKRVTRTLEDEDAEHVEPMSITATVGFVSQREKFSKVIAGKQLKRYVLLKRGEFAYNKGNSKPYPQGCIYRVVDQEQVAVPNVYISFRPTSDAVHGPYFQHYFIAGQLNQQLARFINSGVRNDGLLNLPIDDFFRAQVIVPPLQEQQKISQVLNTADAELSKLHTALIALQSQKKGLMQKLLTGNIRVI